MFKCLCCRGGHVGRQKGGGSHQFSLEDPSLQHGAVLPSKPDGRYRRKKLDDDNILDRFDVAATSQQQQQQQQQQEQRPLIQASVSHSPPVPLQQQVQEEVVEVEQQQQQQPPPPPSPPPPPPQETVTDSDQCPPSGDSEADEAVTEPDNEAEIVVESRTAPQLVVPAPEQPQRQAKLQAPVAPEPVATSGWANASELHENLHGRSVFQSDENETTIVDSDYEDYEDDTEYPDAGKFSARSVATLSVILPRPHAQKVADSEEEQRAAAERLSTFLLASEEPEPADLGWQTMPNGVRPGGHHRLDALIEEESIVVQSQVEPDDPMQPCEEPECAPGDGAAPDSEFEIHDDGHSPPPYAAGEDDSTARESLFALDRALAVFELASIDTEPPAVAAAAGVDNDAELVDEEKILPLNGQERT